MSCWLQTNPYEAIPVTEDLACCIIFYDSAQDEKEKKHHHTYLCMIELMILVLGIRLCFMNYNCVLFIEELQCYYT